MHEGWTCGVEVEDARYCWNWFMPHLTLTDARASFDFCRHALWKAHGVDGEARLAAIADRDTRNLAFAAAVCALLKEILRTPAHERLFPAQDDLGVAGLVMAKAVARVLGTKREAVEEPRELAIAGGIGA
jgi:hypothetical protein